MSVYSTLPKVVARRASTSRTGGEKLGNEKMRELGNEKKRRVETIRCVRKKTEKFGRGEGEVLVKKGCKEGGLSL